MPESVISLVKEQMAKTQESMAKEYKRLRTGRASPSMLEHLRVSYYGSETPLPQVATVSAPEPRMLVIKPFDASAISDIEKAIVKSDMGLNPQNDGKVIRVNIPPLNAETRKKLVNDTKKILEHAKVSVRNARRDGNKELDTMCKNKTISEDIRDSFKDQVQDLTKGAESKLDQIQKEKESELMTV